MTDSEQKKNRDMVKAIVRDTINAINAIMVRWLIGSVVGLLCIGIWVGTIQATVAEHQVYKQTNEPLKQNMYNEQKLVNQKLSVILTKLETIESQVNNHIHLDGHPVLEAKFDNLKDDFEDLNP